MPSRLSIRQLYAAHPDGFVVPYYQRHYMWGQRSDGAKDAAVYLTQCLLDAYKRREKYFLQGLTIVGSHLVDGQQRLTYLYLLMRTLGFEHLPPIRYQNRPDAEAWLLKAHYTDTQEDTQEQSQDIYYFRRTLRTVEHILDTEGVDRTDFLAYVLDMVEMLYINVKDNVNEIALYTMMNGTKAPMLPTEIIKADIMRIAADPSQPHMSEWEINALRSRYAKEWDSWVRWWNTAAVRQYYSMLSESGLDLLAKLCFRELDDDFSLPLSYEEFSVYLLKSELEPYHTAKHIFDRLRRVQRRFEDAFNDVTAYNQLRAVILLLSRTDVYRFLHLYFVDCAIDAAELERYYKMAFLGMTFDEIYAHEPMAEHFDDLFAALSKTDVYHNDTKRDVFNLLLRLNIDEDTKLGRKFDFSVWNNRSLEHIYSKSKVWHTDAEGHVYDGNDNLLPQSSRAIANDHSFMPRESIVTADGTQLSEHCIGNLVLLYGANNAAFGNANFEQKKMMFLAPGDKTVFQSRNLLHTVCVFASKKWNNQSIAENYRLTLKNLKIYYGIE